MTDNAYDETARQNDEFGLEAVRELLQMIRETDVTEIQIERGAAKLHIKRGLPQQPMMITPALAASSAGYGTPLPPMTAFATPSAEPLTGGAAPSEPELAPGSQVIMSPMVGTYYSAASPKDPAFVREGDAIQAGDVVGIVEAMKIMNEIDSEYTGRITRILVANGQPVEYGQPLMVVEPA